MSAAAAAGPAVGQGLASDGAGTGAGADVGADTDVDAAAGACACARDARVRVGAKQHCAHAENLLLRVLLRVRQEGASALRKATKTTAKQHPCARTSRAEPPATE